MFNPFANRPSGLAMPRDILPVTPSDSEELPRVAIGIYV